MTRTAARSLECLVGRMLAYGVHPVAAWRVTSARNRWVLVAGYGAAGYVVGLVTLFAWRP